MQCLQLRLQTNKIKIQTNSFKNPDHFHQENGLCRKIQTLQDFHRKINSG